MHDAYEHAITFIDANLICKHKRKLIIRPIQVKIGQTTTIRCQ